MPSDDSHSNGPPAEIARPELRDKPAVIIGGGPAGLTAGYLLVKHGLPVIVLEAEDQVGGIAKTAVRDGYRFDLGGHRLFNLFFKSYTEKVWGVPTSEIRAEWAAQRIKGLSFFSAAKAAFFGNRGDKIKSLISEFNYPRYGPGQMWETMTDDIQRLGGQVLLNHRVTKLDFDGDRCVRVHVGDKSWEPSAVISSLPLRNTVGMADPHPRSEVIAAAKG